MCFIVILVMHLSPVWQGNMGEVGVLDYGHSIRGYHSIDQEDCGIEYDEDYGRINCFANQKLNRKSEAIILK